MVPESLQVVVVLCQHDATEILYKFTVVVVDCRPGILPYAQILAASFAAVHSTFTLLLNFTVWLDNKSIADAEHSHRMGNSILLLSAAYSPPIELEMTGSGDCLLVAFQETNSSEMVYEGAPTELESMWRQIKGTQLSSQLIRSWREWRVRRHGVVNEL